MDKNKQEYFDYLDELRESGETNMWASPSYLQEEYPELSKQEAREIVKQWMELKK